eukprot:120842-Rhodomonas_salina.1
MATIGDQVVQYVGDVPGCLYRIGGEILEAALRLRAVQPAAKRVLFAQQVLRPLRNLIWSKARETGTRCRGQRVLRLGGRKTRNSGLSLTGLWTGFGRRTLVAAM